MESHGYSYVQITSRDCSSFICFVYLWFLCLHIVFMFWHIFIVFYIFVFVDLTGATSGTVTDCTFRVHDFIPDYWDVKVCREFVFRLSSSVLSLTYSFKSRLIADYAVWA